MLVSRQSSLQFVVQLNVLAYALDDGVVLVAEPALVAQIGPEEHRHDDNQQGDDGDEQDVGVIVHTSLIWVQR